METVIIFWRGPRVEEPGEMTDDAVSDLESQWAL